jgi:hypothetical protein
MGVRPCQELFRPAFNNFPKKSRGLSPPDPRYKIQTQKNAKSKGGNGQRLTRIQRDTEPLMAGPTARRAIVTAGGTTKVGRVAPGPAAQNTR